MDESPALCSLPGSLRTSRVCLPWGQAQGESHPPPGPTSFSGSVRLSKRWLGSGRLPGRSRGQVLVPREANRPPSSVIAQCRLRLRHGRRRSPRHLNRHQIMPTPARDRQTIQLKVKTPSPATRHEGRPGTLPAGGLSRSSGGENPIWRRCLLRNSVLLRKFPISQRQSRPDRAPRG
jgi:hypothetical protein